MSLNNSSHCQLPLYGKTEHHGRNLSFIIPHLFTHHIPFLPNESWIFFVHCILRYIAHLLGTFHKREINWNCESCWSAKNIDCQPQEVKQIFHCLFYTGALLLKGPSWFFPIFLWLVLQNGVLFTVAFTTVPLLCLNSNTVRGTESVHLLFLKTVHSKQKWC